MIFLKIQNIYHHFKSSSKAFSLIELIVVLFIISFVFGIVAQKIWKKPPKIKTLLNQIIRLNNRLVMVSKFRNKIYRLAIQINTKDPDMYWVERKNTVNPKVTTSSQKNYKKTDFVIDPRFYSKPQAIPDTIDILRIRNFSLKKDITQGLFYIYYHPKALAQETRIYLTQKHNHITWSLYLSPIEKTFQIIKE